MSDDRTNYYIQFNEHTYQIEDGEDSDDRFRWQGRTGIDISLNRISRDELKGFDIITTGSSWYYDDIYGFDDIPEGQTAFILLVKYQTGSTFGSEETWCIPAIRSTHEDAKEIEKRIEGENDTEHAYRPWDGYFEHLLSVEVVPLIVT